MIDFVEAQGLAFFAHRLKRLSETLVESCAEWLPTAGISAPPRAGSTLLLLAAEGPLSVTQIAARLRLSHPLIIKLTRELEALGLVTIGEDARDARRRPVALTEAGRAETERFAFVNRRVAEAYRRLFAEAGVDGCAAVERLEAALAARSLAGRLADQAPEAAA